MGTSYQPCLSSSRDLHDLLDESGSNYTPVTFAAQTPCGLIVTTVTLHKIGSEPTARSGKRRVTRLVIM